MVEGSSPSGSITTISRDIVPVSGGVEKGTEGRHPTAYPTDGPKTKTCPKCQKRKRALHFNRRAASRDGLQCWCRDCHRANYRTNPAEREKSLARSAKYRLENPEAKRAQRIVGHLRDSGQLPVEACQECGTTAGVIDAHHAFGYDRPTDIVWLCRSCHVTLEPRRGVAS